MLVDCPWLSPPRLVPSRAWYWVEPETLQESPSENPEGDLHGSGEGVEQLWPQFLQCSSPFKDNGQETKADAGCSVWTPGLSMTGEGEKWSFPSPFGPSGHSDCTATDQGAMGTGRNLLQWLHLRRQQSPSVLPRGRGY